ncbi:MAG: hypothetical protein QXJ38_02480 [Thermofilaceae archaeon]
MKLKVAKVEKYDYADVALLVMEGEGLTASLEVPIKILEEVGWRPAAGDEVELVLGEELGSTDEWDIVMSGKPLKASEGKIAYTFGGLLLTVMGPEQKPLEKVYLKLRRLEKVK